MDSEPKEETEDEKEKRKKLEDINLRNIVGGGGIELIYLNTMLH